MFDEVVGDGASDGIPHRGPGAPCLAPCSPENEGMCRAMLAVPTLTLNRRSRPYFAHVPDFPFETETCSMFRYVPRTTADNPRFASHPDAPSHGLCLFELWLASSKSTWAAVGQMRAECDRVRPSASGKFGTRWI